jgi:hypothetical protein
VGIDRVARWVGPPIVLLVGLGWFWHTEGDDIKHQVKGYSFSETLPKAIDAGGADARVISVIVQDKNVGFTVLTRDGRVQERYYGKVCTSSASGPNCSYREKHDEHDPSARERKAARVPLSELDGGAVDRLRKAARTDRKVPLGIRGRRWVVGSYEPSVAAIANLDGSNVRRAETAAEIALARSVASEPAQR